MAAQSASLLTSRVPPSIARCLGTIPSGKALDAGFPIPVGSQQEPAIAGHQHVLHVAFGPGGELGAGRRGAE